MLYEMAVADAFGIAYEFVDPERTPPVDLSRFAEHPKYVELRPGRYTDDTQRAIANALTLLDGNPLDPMSYVENYIRVFRADPRKGYSRRYQAFLEGICDRFPDDAAAAVAFNREIVRRPASNGSLMGVAVLGYLRDPNTVALAAAIQAMTTHSVDTVVYAQAVALVAHRHLYASRYPGIDLDEFVARHVSSDTIAGWAGDATERVDMTARNTYRAIRQMLAVAKRSNATLTDLLRLCVERGGDTDSLAATTVAIAKAAGVPGDLPSVLSDTVEDDAGRAYLRALDARLEAFLVNAS